MGTIRIPPEVKLVCGMIAAGVRIAEDAEHGGIAFSPDDRRLAYWALGQTIKVCDVATGKERWQFEAGGSFVASPVVSGGKLVIGNTDGKLYCFGKEE